MSKALLMPALVAGALVFGSLVAEAAGKAPSDAQKATLSTCLACHDITPAKAKMFGPALHGLAGAKPRSPGMPGKAWDKKSLDAFLADPQKYKPGSTMPLKVTDPAQRAAMVKALLELK